MQTTNPTYDTFYNLLFEDPYFAKKVLSMSIEKNFISIELYPQELTTIIPEKYLSVLRVDFKTIIYTLDNNKQKVLAEELKEFVKKLNQPLQTEYTIYKTDTKDKIETKLVYETPKGEQVPNAKMYMEQVKLHIEQVKVYLEESKIKSEQEKIRLEQEKTQMEQAKMKSEQITVKLERIKVKSDQAKEKFEPTKVKPEQQNDEVKDMIIKKMLLLKLLTVKQISDFQNVPIQRVLEIQNKLNLE